MELGSVTLKRIGFFCFPIKHSTHTCKCPPPPHMTCLCRWESTDAPDMQVSSSSSYDTDAPDMQGSSSSFSYDMSVPLGEHGRPDPCPPTLIRDAARADGEGGVSPLYQHARGTAWLPSWRSHVLSIPALRCEAVACVDKRDRLYK
jgi:hypothetical protein